MTHEAKVPLVLLIFLFAVVICFALPYVKNIVVISSLLVSPAPVANSLPSPLAGQSFVDTWGAARSGGRKHEGIDIFAPRNTPIKANIRGIVVQIGFNSLGGRTVSILGAGRYKHYYAHLESYPRLKSGDLVKPGDVIGYVGDSGNARGTPTHLHYGIYTLSGAVNPYIYLKKN